MPLEFKNEATKAKYEVAFAEQKDCNMHIPAGKKRGSGYAGKLSDITPEAAAKYLAQGGNLIKEKKASPVVEKKDNKNAAADNK